jgi:hypothetical protein
MKHTLYKIVLLLLIPTALYSIKHTPFNSLHYLTTKLDTDVLTATRTTTARAIEDKHNASITDKNVKELLDESKVYAKAQELSKHGFGQWALVRNFIDRIATASATDKVALWNKWSTMISLSDPGALNMQAIMSAAIIEAIVPALTSESALASFTQNPTAYARVNTILPGVVHQQEAFSHALIQGIAALPLALLGFLGNTPAITHEIFSLALPGHAQILAISNNGEYVAWIDTRAPKGTVSSFNISRFQIVENQVRQVQSSIVIKAEMPQAYFYVSFTESNGQALIVEAERTQNANTSGAILFYNLDLERAFESKVEKYQLTRVNSVGFKNGKGLIVKAGALSNCKKIIALGFTNGLVQIYENNDDTNVYELFKSYETDRDGKFVNLVYNDYDQSMYITVQNDQKFSLTRYLILSDKGTVFEKMAQFDANGFMFLTLFGKDMIAVQEDNSTPAVTVLNGMNGATVRTLPLVNSHDARTVHTIFAETKNYGPFFNRSHNVLSVFREKISNKAHTLYQIALQAPIEMTGLTLDQALVVHSVFKNFIKGNKSLSICAELKKIYESMPRAVKNILMPYIEVCK